MFLASLLWVTVMPCLSWRGYYSGFVYSRVKSFGARVGITGRCKDKLEDFQGIVLTSHKGFADFFVTSQLHFSAPLARLIIGLIFPPIFATSKYGNSCLLVHRRRGSRIKATKEQIAEKNNRLADLFDDFVRNRNPRLLIYPEGSRYSARGVFPFRSGLFRIAFNKKLKLLICPCEGSQYVVKEKQLFIHPQDVVIPPSHITPDISSVGPIKEGDPCRGYILFNICDVLDPSDFSSFEEFKAEAERCFTAGYKDMVVNDKQSTFCLLTQGDVVYVGNASVNISITHIFNYLRTISSAFQKKFSDVLQSPSDTSLFSSFKATISEQAKQYVEKASSAKLDELNADLEDVRTVLTKNFQDLTERGEKLDIVEEQARNLMNDSRDFKKKSQDLYNASGWNDYLPHLIIIAIVLFLLIKNMIFPSKKD
ncbi:hypothetical protein BLNAU_134 [Blattamonas nauphoetae]|uniref:V-SNARE coiled-coil homology domain-containing protein n=1 Tax=Blattamonas nauphoetae TaxID=2049346 RepID=A0ABQ9YMR0_9EUKA|nr:hypothetical protein BLNAU_134 [Blattamonas nauphoetae]